MLKYLRYRYARTKMAAYINGEVSTQTRRVIGRLINEDERVYNEYIRQRQTKQELERQLPVFGRAEAGQLDALWANIQAELDTSKDEPVAPPVKQRARYSMSYGFAIGLCVIALIIPFVFDASEARAATIPQKLLPETVEFTTPETPSAQPTSVAVAARPENIATVAIGKVATDLQNTPAPFTPGR